MIESNTKFPSGQVVATRSVALHTERDPVYAEWVGCCLARHLQGDWGDVAADSYRHNAESLTTGDRLMSSYGKGTEQHLWIITEGEGEGRVTTILEPSDY